ILYSILLYLSLYHLFFFNDTSTTEIYTLSLHDALPILIGRAARCFRIDPAEPVLSQIEPLDKDVNHANRIVLANPVFQAFRKQRDRKSTRLNSSHVAISYAVFCLKKKKKKQKKK